MTGEPENPSEGGTSISYDEVQLQQSAGMKPMIVTAAIILTTWILLTGLPMYWQTGDGELTLFSYTTVLWGIIVVIMGFVYEYWITSLENQEGGS